MGLANPDFGGAESAGASGAGVAVTRVQEYNRDREEVPPLYESLPANERR